MRLNLSDRALQPWAVLLVFLVLLALVTHSIYQERNFGGLPQVYEQRAEARIAFECADVRDEDLAYCRNEIQELEYRKLLDHLDLLAQQSMAASTFGVLLASIVAVVVTAVGIYFVRETLRQSVAATRAAKDAVKVTREIGQAQVRAYLSVTDVEVVNPLSETLVIRAKIQNTGATPAREVSVACTIEIRNKVAEALGGGIFSTSFVKPAPLYDIKSGFDDWVENITDGNQRQEIYEAITSSTSLLTATVTIFARDVFFREIIETFVFEGESSYHHLSDDGRIVGLGLVRTESRSHDELEA